MKARVKATGEIIEISQIRNLMCFDPSDDNSEKEYFNSFVENLKKYQEEHK